MRFKEYDAHLELARTNRRIFTQAPCRRSQWRSVAAAVATLAIFACIGAMLAVGRL